MSGLRRKLQQCMSLNNYVEATRQNTDSVTLTDAVSNGLVDLKAYGKSEVKGEVFTSVVAKGKCEQFIEGLPDTYTPLEYIETTGTQYLNTGIIPTINTKAEVKFAPTAVTTIGYWGLRTDPYRFCCTTFTNGTQFGIGMTNNTWPVNRTSITLENIYDCVIANGYASINGTEYTETPVTLFETTSNFYLGLTNNNYSQARYYTCKLWENDVLIFNGIPAKNSNDEIGMYDTVSETFFTKSGTDDFVAGSTLPAPSAPINITCNNGKLVFRDTELPVEYRRLQDIIFDGDTYYISDYHLTGADTVSFIMNATDSGRNVLGCYSGSSSGNNLSFYVNTGSAGNYVRYKDSLYRPVLNNSDLGIDKALSITPTGTVGFATNSTWSPLEFTCTEEFYIGWLANATSPKFMGSFKGTISIANNRDFIPCERVSDGEIGYYDTAAQQFLENQSTGTPTTSGYDYSHYSIVTIDGTQETITSSGGGMVLCENLLSVGNNVDTQSILDGAVTRKIGVKVLNGTEDSWVKTNNSFGNTSLFADKKTEKSTLFCSHFQYDIGTTSTIPDNCIGCASTSTHTYFRYDALSTVDDWKQFLADQYAAGTPVIVIYPLAAATTETVASQSLKYGELAVEGSLEDLEVETTESLSTTPTPENPLDIYCNNGVLKIETIGNPIDNIKITVEGDPETLTIKGNNLYDVTKDVNGKYIDANGNIGDEARSCYCDLIPVKPGETYTYSGICKSSSGTSNNKRIHGYIDGIWNQQIKVVTADRNKPFYDSFVIPAGINGIRISHWYEDENTQVEESPRPTKYCEYLNSDLSVQDLLGIGNYQDIQSIIDGVVTRNVGVKVLDGTEAWSKRTDTGVNRYQANILPDKVSGGIACLCSHFQNVLTFANLNDNCFIVDATARIIFDEEDITTLIDWQQWLADQYAAGTPVIVIYPLATPTTESVAKQSANITSNTNIVERNSENVSGLKVEAIYKKLR